MLFFVVYYSHNIMAPTKPKSRKPLSIFSLIMINIIAVDSLRTLPIGAEYGFSIVFFYLLAALIFFIPTALVAAELATGWPQTGGIYIWVREAFGKRLGFFTIWLQWIYNVVWYPTILAFIAATLIYLFNPLLANNKLYLLATIIIIFWTATFVNCLGIRASSWVSTVGALIGTIIPMLFIIALGIGWLTQANPIYISFDRAHFFPDLSHLQNLVFFVAILFGLIGMEMSATHAEDVKNPQRDYPRALLYSTLIILITLIFASLAIALVVPHSQLSLVSGLIDAFSIFFTAYHLPWMVPIIAILISIGGIGGVSTWIIGPTRGLLIASRDNEMSQSLQQVNRHDAPTTILITQAIIFTALCSVFLFMPSINSSYWMLSAMTAQLALIVYIMMFAAAIRLRYKHKNIKRAYKIPGGNVGMCLVAGTGIFTCFAAIILGFLPPPEINIANTYYYESSLGFGILLICAIPGIMHWHKRRKSNLEPQ